MQFSVKIKVKVTCKKRKTNTVQTEHFFFFLTRRIFENPMSGFNKTPDNPGVVKWRPLNVVLGTVVSQALTSTVPTLEDFERMIIRCSENIE